MAKSLLSKAAQATQPPPAVEPQDVQAERCGRINVRAELRLRNNDLIQARKRYGLSQLNLSEAVGIPLAIIGALEKFDYSNANIETHARRLADFLELPLALVLPPELHKRKLTTTVIAVADIEAARLLDVAVNRKQLLPTSPLELAEQTELSDRLQSAMSGLTVRENAIISLRFGLGECPLCTLEEVSEKLHIHRETVRQVEAKALLKLRHPVRARGLEEFLDRALERHKE